VRRVGSVDNPRRAAALGDDRARSGGVRPEPRWLLRRDLPDVSSVDRRAKGETHLPGGTDALVAGCSDAAGFIACAQQPSPPNSAESLMFFPCARGLTVGVTHQKRFARQLAPPQIKLPGGRETRALSPTVLSRLKRTHVEILSYMLRGKTTTAELSKQTGYAERTVTNKLQYIYSSLGVRRKIDLLSLCHTDPGLKNLLASFQD